ncbi:MAG: diaminopimelate epimerase [Ferruginibacter sp.]
MKIEFYKYQGTGNDFVILENRDNKYDNLTREQVKHICNRRFGVGADGLMLLSNHTDLDFNMIYFNADGNESSMCGNGGRCLVKFANHRGMYKSTYRFMAIDGPHEADIDMHEIVRLKMQDVHEVDYHSGYAILNTGSPHFVKFADNVEDIDVVETGREIRYSKKFEKEGINVNFVETIDADGIFVRTYERGVEDETMSCGTGVTAAALMNAHNDNGFNRVEVRTPGGNLSVEFNKMDDDNFENIWLCGPAEFVYKGEIDI